MPNHRGSMNLFQENAIVTAQNFNVTLLSQLWLIKNGIIAEEELDGTKSIFTPPMVHVITPRFALLAVEDRIQFTPFVETGKGELVSNRLGRIVELLPHTPYTAAGLNFIWHYVPKNETVSSIGRRLFLREGTAIAKVFEGNDAKFGGYFSKDVLGFRMKFMVMPAEVRLPGQSEQDIIQFSFNYHFESSNYLDICEALRKWDRAQQDSRDLISAVETSL